MPYCRPYLTGTVSSGNKRQNGVTSKTILLKTDNSSKAIQPVSNCNGTTFFCLFCGRMTNEYSGMIRVHYRWNAATILNANFCCSFAKWLPFSSMNENHARTISCLAFFLLVIIFAEGKNRFEYFIRNVGQV